jgi:FkbM family methyltransferase
MPPFKYSSVPGDAIGSILFWGQPTQFEADTIDIFSKLVRKCRCFFDIGANTGLFSLIACAANPHVAVVAFEPVPGVFRHLQDNLRINGWQHRCLAINEAVADKSGQAFFHVPNVSVPTSGSLNVNGFRGNRGNVLPVNVTTVDNVVERIGRPDLVKVDVEGFEDKVFEGMKTLLREDAPIVIVECLPDGPHKAFEPMLTSLGYHYFHLTRDKVQAMPTIRPDPHEECRNYLVVPPNRLNWLDV